MRPMYTNAVRGALQGCLGLALALPLAAQELRDPTAPPPELAGAPAAGVDASPLGNDGMMVLVRDGKPYLVVGTRLVATGGKVGQFRLERITESQVWLRDGKSLRKIPRFSGVQRSSSAPQAPAPACRPTATQKSKAVACDGPQP